MKVIELSVKKYIYLYCTHCTEPRNCFISSIGITFFLVSWGGVRLSPLGTSAINWLIVPAPDDRWWRVWSCRWNENRQGKLVYSEKTCPSATLSTTNPTWPDLGSNPGRRGGKPAPNHLSYDTVTGITLNWMSGMEALQLVPRSRKRGSIHPLPP
jgi:hypothetical protein